MRYLSHFVCLKYLRSKRIVFLSIAAVAMSCALLIVVASLFTGFINAIERSASENLGDVVINSPGTSKIGKFDELIEKLKSNRSIESATAVLSTRGILFMGRGDVRAVQVMGVEFGRRDEVVPFTASLLEGGAGLIEEPDSGGDFSGVLGIGVISRPTKRRMNKILKR